MPNPSGIDAPEFVEAVELTRWMIERDNLWHENLESPDAFARSCKKRGIDVDKESVVRLWQLGLLRADVIIATKKLRRPGLVLLKKIAEAQYAYGDGRPHRIYPDGLGRAAARFRDLDPAIQLRFHPFRFFVLYMYDRICRSYPAPSFLSLSVHRTLLRKSFEAAQRNSGSGRVVSSFAKVNAIAGLAIASEPWAYPRLFNRWSIRFDHDDYLKALDDHWDKLRSIYEVSGESPILDGWNWLCNAAVGLEPNVRLHEKLRLARSEVREKQLKGPLAGAMFLKTMAETLRRTAEATFETRWPEEGEHWEGGDYKDHAYGARRIFDGDRNASNEVLKTYWRGIGLQATWYVEGSTELGALKEFFGPNPVGISFVNLQGRLDTRLPELLKNDRVNGIYSIISVDGDRRDNLKLLQLAAKADKFFGLCHISVPDFEFANFSLVELQEILWQIATENKAPPESHALLIESTKDATGKTQLLKGAQRLKHLRQLPTNEAWGRRLIDFARKNPRKDEEAERPIIRALHDGRRAAYGLYSHRHDMRERRVDPVTLDLVDKNPKAPS